ncbi:hypothetical protein MINS_19710 [Mycolicibacterium insubricum]|nr:hypothetical protein MINS_19710 [Mycolicibacterium insubricum]
MPDGGRTGGGNVEDGADPVDDVDGAAVPDFDVVATDPEVAAGAERGAVPQVRVGAGAGTPAVVVGVPDTVGVVTVTVVVTGAFDESFEQPAPSSATASTAIAESFRIDLSLSNTVVRSIRSRHPAKTCSCRRCNGRSA